MVLTGRSLRVPCPTLLCPDVFSKAERTLTGAGPKPRRTLADGAPIAFPVAERGQRAGIRMRCGVAGSAPYIEVMGMVHTVGLVLHPDRDARPAVDTICGWAGDRVTVLGLLDEIGRIECRAVGVGPVELVERASLLVSLGGFAGLYGGGRP